jgi:hypothetical protein
MDDIIGSIEGTMTFKKVTVEWEEENDRFVVTGEYQGRGQEVTPISAPAGHLHVAGAEVQKGASFVLEKDDYIWAESTGEDLYLRAEKEE